MSFLVKNSNTSFTRGLAGGASTINGAMFTSNGVGCSGYLDSIYGFELEKGSCEE